MLYNSLCDFIHLGEGEGEVLNSSVISIDDIRQAH